MVMNADRFWSIIESACESNPYLAEQWSQRLTDSLAKLSAGQIIRWNHIFDHCAAAAYRADLWAAAYLINGGASDDGFYYFRCWLIGMGKTIYDAAILDPDSLADVVTPDWLAEGITAEAEIYGAAHQAWMEVTGASDTVEYPARNEEANLIGEGWDFDDTQLMKAYLPRLSSLYLEK